MICVALAAGGKRQCRNPCDYSSVPVDLCDVHTPLLHERGELQTIHGPVRWRAATATTAIAAGDAPAGAKTEDAPNRAGDLRSEQPAPDGDIPPDLWDAVDGPAPDPATDGEEPDRPEPPPPPPGSDGGSEAGAPPPPPDGPTWDLHSSPPPPPSSWSPEAIREILRGPVQAVHERAGLAPLTDMEIESGGDHLAPILAEWMASVDPNSPAGLAALWIALVYGPRLGPRIVPAVLARIRGRRPPAPDPGTRRQEEAGGDAWGPVE